MTSVQGKRVLIVGLARTGLAAAHVLARRGAAVTVTDARPPWELRADMGDLLANKIGMELGLHREETFLKQDFIVVSPGVLPDMPQLQAARAKNIPVVSEIEVASWLLEAPMIGITGSNGKTTTTALLGEILEASTFPTFVGGNIGVPVISAVDEVPRDALVVTELSSFQLEATVNFRPHVAALLNITPNHLDRHPTLEAYIQAKARIFANQTADDFAILNADDPAVMDLAPGIAARKILFSRKGQLPEGLFAENGHIVYRVGNLERVLLTTKEIALRGEFNVENVMAAAASACVVGADFEAIRRGVAAFRGVEHRLEFVQEIHGVQYYNDSKATSVDAAAKALSAFGGGVHLILGGKDKGAPYTPIRKLLDGRVRDVYLIGVAAERIEKQLAGTVPLHDVGDLESAVQEAFERAVPGDVVLLSPACASFDQFQDYEHRGRVFKEIVKRLAALPVQPRHGAQDSNTAVRMVPIASEVPVAQSEPPELRLEPPPPPMIEPPSRPTEAPEAIPVVEPLPAPLEEGPEVVAIPEANESTESHGSDEEPELRISEALPGTPGEPQPPHISTPEPIYLYELSAEEMVYPEADFVMSVDESDEAVITLESIPAAESATDQALPFEVRTPVAAAVATRAEPDPPMQQGADSGNGARRESRGNVKQ
ncbi:MAG: UDP-N-acetylmuramoyl-L-alanine--D-glutamate ligase [Acidobacteria bacterium]|nr:UDP-N-acetylmuramoyl-L-alanine--D-glutamate ligase [Acidobacteriota bacterium]